MIEANQFNNREAIENHVISTYGRSTDLKEDEISGTIQELKKLQLKHGQMIWGVKVVATDYQVRLIPEKVNRGEIYPSKINGRVVKHKK